MTFAKSSCVGGASWADVSAAVLSVSVTLLFRLAELTQWNVVVRLHRHALPYLDFVDCLENGQAMAYAADAHFLELGML